MNILFIGDPHLKISNFDTSCKFLSWVIDVVKDKKPDVVINLGDTFNDHAVLRSELLTEFRNHAKDITRMVPYFYILGNHDFFKPTDSKYHALETFQDIRNLKIISAPSNLADDITMVPYIPNYVDFPLQTNKICIAHQTFVGADYGYHRPDIGVDADKVSAEIIISGHVHKRQMFGKVIYPGTPFSQSVNDINQSKGLMLFDTDTYRYSFIESPFPSWKGMKFDISEECTIKDMHTGIVDYINDKDYWVIDIIGPKAEINAYMESDSVLELKQKYMIRFRPEYNDKDKNNKVKIRSTSMQDILNQYLSSVYKGSIDKSIIEDKALEIFKKVNVL